MSATERYDHFCHLFESCIDTLWGRTQSERTWTVAAAIVAWTKDREEVLSVGFGTKCPGKAYYDTQGYVLHDCHAETLARRGLVHYFLREICGSNEDETSTSFSWLERTAAEIEANTDGTTVSETLQHVVEKVPKFRLRRDCTLTMLFSELPCGDAAVVPDKEERNTVDRQQEMDIPSKRQRTSENICERGNNSDVFHRATGAKPLAPEASAESSRQRQGYLRLKPGRTDLPSNLQTESISCTDKLTRWMWVGMEGALLSLFLSEPLRIHEYLLLLSPKSPYSMEKAKESMETCITERVKYVLEKVLVTVKPYALPVHRYKEHNSVPCAVSLAFVSDQRGGNVFEQIRKFDKDSKIGIRKMATVNHCLRLHSDVKIKLVGWVEKITGHRGITHGANSSTPLFKAQSRLSKGSTLILWLLAVHSTSELSPSMSEKLWRTTYRDIKELAVRHKSQKTAFRDPSVSEIFSDWKSKRDKYDEFRINITEEGNYNRQ